MPKLSRRSFAMFLALTPGIGGAAVARVLARNELQAREPDDFFRLSDAAWREEYRLAPRAIDGLRKGLADELESFFDVERSLQGLGVRVVTAVDANYPTLIEEFDPDPPGVLFLYGNERLLDTRKFAVLSSRKSRPGELERIEQLSEEGVLAGETLVCGHDTPEYQRAAVVPLRWASPRILCLDRGFFRVLGPDLASEAFRAARLWRYEFDAATDLAVSPFRPEAGYIGVNNQVRDRLLASLADRLDFVQVRPGGNMAKLAGMALKAQRHVRVGDLSPAYAELALRGAKPISMRPTEGASLP